MKDIHKMSVDEIAEIMGSELAVGLFKGNFRSLVIRWAMVIYNLAQEKSRAK